MALDESRCLIWEGDWSRDVLTVAAERGRKGIYGKIVLTVCDEVGLSGSVCNTASGSLLYIVTVSWPQDTANVFTSIHQDQKKCLFPDSLNSTDLSCTLNQSAMNETVGSRNWFFKFLHSKRHLTTSLRRRWLLTPPTWAIAFAMVRSKWTKLTPVNPLWKISPQFGQQ